MNLKEIIDATVNVKSKRGAILLICVLAVGAFFIVAPRLNDNTAAWLYASLILFIGLMAFLLYFEKDKNIHRPSKTTKTKGGVPFVGYFCTEVDGFERILIRIDNASTWGFPICGIVDSQANASESINDYLGDWCAHNSLAEHDLHDSGFYSPLIIPIYDKQSLLSIGQTPSITAYLVKVNVGKEFDVMSGDGKEVYSWQRKLPLFFSGLVSGLPASKETESYLTFIRQDKVQREFTLNVLECVDILVFREVPGSDPEFLLLHRIDHSNSNDGWEYPKGGLEIHETIIEGGVRELLEETGIDSVGDFRYGGYLGVQSPKVVRKQKPYNSLRVHGLTYLFIGDSSNISKHVSRNSHEHNNLKWSSLEEARDSLWIKEFDYGPRFFRRWQLSEREIFNRVTSPVSLAFQITETCFHGCRYCLRRIERENSLSVVEIRELIDELASRNILMLTFTGGEPLEYGKDALFELIKYANRKRIHTTLSTTGVARNGVEITKSDIVELNHFTDHILLSVDCLTESIADQMYSKIDNWESLLNKALSILRWTKDTSIIAEVCTVATKVNYEEVIAVGRKLFEIDVNIFWKIDEYYYNGPVQQAPHDGLARDKFEMPANEFAKLREIIKNDSVLSRYYDKQIRFNSKESRQVAPDVMITPQGNLVHSSNNAYAVAGTRADIKQWEFGNRRSYTEYRDYCRLWDWETTLTL